MTTKDIALARKHDLQTIPHFWTGTIHPSALWHTVAIIPVHGRHADTHTLVSQCFREPVDVIIVDNRGDYESIAREIVLTPGSNLGWLNGTNHGWLFALARHWHYFVLLNNDLTLSSDFFAGLLIAAADTNAGVTAPCYNGDWKFQHPRHHPLTSAASYTPSRFHFQIGFCDGTAMCVPRPVVERIGVFDPEFCPDFGWGASTDFCIRCKQHGCAVYATEAAYCDHAGHSTARQLIGDCYHDLASQEQKEYIARRADFRHWHADANALALPMVDGAPQRCNISVITATRGRPEALRHCCAQFSAQRLRGLSAEHIIVSDGPEYHARTIAESHGARYLTSYKPKPFKRGDPSARDVGIRVAFGDYLVFWDDDNDYEVDNLYTLFQAAIGHDIGVCKARHVGQHGIERVIPTSFAGTFTFGDVDTMCVCVRRDVALRARWSDGLGEYASDFIWLSALEATGAHIQLCDAIVGTHRASTPERDM